MRQLLAILLVTTIALVACGPTESPPPSATPDVPIFADGEAIAVVKTWLSGVTYETVRKEYTCFEVTPTPSILPTLKPPRGTLKCKNVPAGMVTHNCLNIHRNFEWDSAYQGNSVWAVTAQKGDRKSEWRVFEGTSAVDSVEVYGRCG